MELFMSLSLGQKASGDALCVGTWVFTLPEPNQEDISNHISFDQTNEVTHTLICIQKAINLLANCERENKGYERDVIAEGSHRSCTHKVK